MISRRGLLLASAGAVACGRRKATAYPGYCFVANRQGRNVTVVDLSRFRVRKQIALDAAPSLVIAHPEKPFAYALAPANGTVYEPRWRCAWRRTAGRCGFSTAIRRD